MAAYLLAGAVGICLVVEAFLTPGTQIAESLVGGSLIGFGTARSIGRIRGKA